MVTQRFPWWNGSAKKLCGIWLPVQIVIIAVISVTTYYLFLIPRENVSLHSVQLLYMGMLLQEYFCFMALKDTFIFATQLFFGGFMGFWNALVHKLVTMPLDIIVLLSLSIWGSVVLN